MVFSYGTNHNRAIFFTKSHLNFKKKRIDVLFLWYAQKLTPFWIWLGKIQKKSSFDISKDLKHHPSHKSFLISPMVGGSKLGIGTESIYLSWLSQKLFVCDDTIICYRTLIRLFDFLQHVFFSWNSAKLRKIFQQNFRVLWKWKNVTSEKFRP